MREDAIFRIASMTKPFASLAIMMLAEEGKLSIVDPAHKYLPELRDMKVAVISPGTNGKPSMTFEPQRRPMTVQDLLRHTSGLPSGLAGGNPVKQMYFDARIGNRADTSDAYIKKLSTRFPVIGPRASAPALCRVAHRPRAPIPGDCTRYSTSPPSG